MLFTTVTDCCVCNGVPMQQEPIVVEVDNILAFRVLLIAVISSTHSFCCTAVIVVNIIHEQKKDKRH